MEQKGTNGNKKELREGFIYSIRSSNTDKIYIGSTFNNLNKRFYCHRAQYKAFLKDSNNKCCMSKEIFKHGGAYIELIKTVQVNNRFELYKYEGEEQRKHKNILVNKNLSRTIKESRQEYKHNHRQENKEKYKKRDRANYLKSIKNNVLCTVCNITLTERNYKYSHQKGKKHKNNLKLQEQEKQKIKEIQKDNININCLECSITFKKRNIKRHLKTKKHLENSKTQI